MKKIGILFFISLFFLQGFSSKLMKGDSMSKQEIEKIKKAIEARVLKYANDMKSCNIEKMLTFWADSEDFVAAPDAKMIVGYKNFAELQRKSVTEISSVENVVLTDMHTYVLARDAASITFKFNWSKTKKSGEKIHSKGTWTYVLKLFDGQWKVLHSTGTHIYE